MKKLFIVLGMSIVLGACASKPVTTNERPVANEKVSVSEKPTEVKPSSSVATVDIGPSSEKMSIDAGKSLYENNCAKCHKLFEPKEFNKEEWKPILVKMQKKAHLNDSDMVGISAYIDSQL